MKNILFFGDSLTAGYGLLNVALESLPALFQKKIDDAGLDYKVINAGVSGETSAAGLIRVDLFLNNQVDIFVLELGANDGLRGVSAAKTAENLQQIINKVRVKFPSVKILLLGMEIPAWIPGANAAAFRSIFRQLAIANNIPLVPFLLDGVAGIKELNLNDGLHPSAAGYQVIAEKVWPKLQQLT